MTAGIAAVLAAVVLWGIQLPIAKMAFEHVDPYHVTLIRYGVATLILTPLMAFNGWPSSLRSGYRLRALAVIGIIGMSVSPLLTYLGLSYSRPEHAAIISALQPLMIAVVQWYRHGNSISSVTWSCIAMALLGVTAVISGGRPLAMVSASELAGSALVFGGAVAWVTFTVASARFKAYPPLQFTTLTIAAGTASTLMVVAAAEAAGLTPRPSAGALADAWWQLLYLSLGSVIIAMYCWNLGNQRIGPLNAMLFINLQPVVTFGFVFLLGGRFSFVEITGAVFVVGALLTHSAHLRYGADGTR